MARFLIEVPHEADIVACERVIETFLKTGSRFLTNADWGYSEGEQKAWIMVEVQGKKEAQCILPPTFRSQAKVVRLNKFTLEGIGEILRHHGVT